MKIVSAKQQGSVFTVSTEGDRTIIVPDDMDNSDRVQLQEWLDEGNELEEDAPERQQQPSYNWQGLAISFKFSQLNQLLNQLKDENTNPQISPIWRISDDLVQLMTLPVFSESNRFSESDRVAELGRDFQLLFEKLDEGKVDVPRSAVEQIVQALRDDGFGSVAETLSRSSVA